MNYRIFENGKEINIIVSDASFVADYCSKNGYTYEEAPLPVPEPDPQPTTEERVAALEAENKLLKEQVSAQADQAEFYEDCIAEMATVVYA